MLHITADANCNLQSAIFNLKFLERLVEMEKKFFWLIFGVLSLMADLLLPFWWAVLATFPILLLSWWVVYRSEWF